MKTLLNLRIALKNVLRKDHESILSLIGLAISFASICFIFLYVSFQLGYDAHNKNSDRIYRISGDIIATENTMTHAVLGPLMAPALKDAFPGVESFVRLFPIHQTNILEVKSERYPIEEAYAADPSVFDVFTLKLIYGNKKDALNDPNDIVINESLSKKMFGDANPVGESLKRDGQLLTISGVIEDSPKNAHHKLNVLFSTANIWRSMEGLTKEQKSEGYWMPSAYHFILMKQGAEIRSIAENFSSFYDKYMADFGKVINVKFNPVFIPLKDLHFSANMSYDYPKGNSSYIYLLILTGFFILLIASINYSNLLTSQNIVQSKNTGIKKIVGASNAHIYRQLFANSMVFITISFMSGYLIYLISLPYVSKWTNFNAFVSDPVKVLPTMVVVLIVLVIITSLIPFLSLINKKGIDLIKPRNNKDIKIGNIRFGRFTTIIQYTFSVILIISSIVVTRQIYFMVHSDMGFDKDDILVVNISKGISENPGNIQVFKEALLKNTMISSVSNSTNIPGEVLGSSHIQFTKDGEMVTKIVNTMGIDYDYIQAMGMKMLKGRSFDKDMDDGKNRSLIVNEAFIDFCGLDENIVGNTIDGGTVIGILKNVSFNSLHNPTEPLVFYLQEQPQGYLNIKLNTKNIPETIAALETSWNKFFGEIPLEWQFLDVRIKMMYAEDQQVNFLVKSFTVISIILSVMGLLNLSSIIIKRKIKEIGIRKVNGARSSDVVLLLGKEFITWVILSFTLAVPVSWYVMFRWLENFAFKVPLSWWIFVIAGVLAMVIAMLTVGWHSWRAASRNPVDALKYE